jgi:hypothetical protein
MKRIADRLAADEQLTIDGSAPRAAPKHPARFSEQLLPVLAGPLAAWGLPVHDPFAGTGERLGGLCDQLGLTFTGAEIEPEWIVDERVARGDSTEASTYPTGEYVIATSPSYPNGMSDHFKASDSSKRNTYRQALAETIGHDRPLHENNSGRYGVRYGAGAEARYWRIVRRAVGHWPALVAVNVKDFYTAGELYPLVGKWIALLEQAGYAITDRTDVPCPGQRFGANRDRAETEAVLVAEKARDSGVMFDPPAGDRRRFMR